MGQKIANTDPIGNLTSILDMFNGKSVTDTIGGSTTTTRVDYSDAQLQDQMRSALGGVNGLASLSSGERQAGMYNSTVRQGQTNDLLARIITEATAKKVGQTVTTSGSKNTKEADAPLSGGKATKPLLLAGLGALLNPTVSRLKDKLGVGALGDKIADTIFGGAGAEIAMPAAGTAADAFAAAYPVEAGVSSGGVLGSGLFETGADSIGLGELFGGAAGAGTDAEVAVEAAAGAEAGGAGALASAGPIGAAILAAMALGKFTETSHGEDTVKDFFTNPIEGTLNQFKSFFGI